MFQELGLELLCFDLGARIDLYLVQTNLFNSSGKSIHDLTLYAVQSQQKSDQALICKIHKLSWTVGFEISAISHNSLDFKFL